MKYQKIAMPRVMLAVVLIVSGFQTTPDHKILFEKAKFAMETKGDLQGAIKLFQEIIAKYPQEKEYAARAQLYIGLCFEKLGNTEAIKAYELVLKKYADRPEEVAIARERLSILRQEAISGISVVNLSLRDNNFEPKALSPDGTKMLGIDYESGENIAFYDIAGSRKVLLTHFNLDDRSSFASDPIWSPDGKQIAYEQGPLRVNVRELRVSTLDGKSRVLCRNEEGWITPSDWLRDGSAIVATLWHGTRPETVGLAFLSGESFKPLFSIPADWKAGDPYASPDSRFIALEGGPEGSQDIYIVRVDDGSSWVLADHPADDRSPRWSPDGKYIVFLSLRRGSWALWGLSVKDGNPTGQPFLIKEGMPDAYLNNWTASGLLFSNWFEFKDIYIQEVDPKTNELIGQPRLLPYWKTGGNVSPSWSPDGKYLAFASSLSFYEMTSRGHIVIMPVDGSNAREFNLPLAHPSSPLLYPDIRWLPDSSGLGYTIKDEKGQEALLRLNIASGEWKTFPLPTDIFTDIEWSDDGKSFFYAKHSHFDGPDAGIIEHDMETGKDRYVYRPEKGKGRVFRSFRCSRDYKKLVIEQIDYVQNEPKEVCQIFTLDLESGKLQTVTSALEGPVLKDWVRFAWPAWSPDNKNLMVLYNDDRSGLPKDLGIIPVAGGPLEKLPITLNWPSGEGFISGFRSFDWSPDGKKIAFTVLSGKYDAILIKNVLGEKR